MSEAPDALRLVPVNARDLDALRYVLNRADETSRIRTVMSTFTLPELETTAERLERLYAVLKSASPAVQPAAGREEIARVTRWIDNGMPDTSDHTPHRDRLRQDLRAILAAISTPAQASGEPVAMEFPYQRTFNAIADAVTQRAGGVGISVEAFQRSFNAGLAHPPAQASETGGEAADDLGRMTCFINNRGDPDDWAAWCRIRSALSAPQAAPGEGEQS